jgi:hypothetical protein
VGINLDVPYEDTREPRDEALHLTRDILTALPKGIGEEEARRLIDAWLAESDAPRAIAKRAGRAGAQRDLADGALLYFGAGLLLRMDVTCPRCMVTWSVDEPPARCDACSAPLIRGVSQGCVLETNTFARIDAYNEVVEEHIRRLHNANFDWSRVRRRSDPP